MSQAIIKELTGHSGCTLNLIKENETLLISKTSPHKNYNSRLKRQWKKQSGFVAKGNVFAPKTCDYGYVNDLFFFNMQFIHGETLAQYTSNIMITEIVDCIKELFKCLYMEESTVSPYTPSIFLKKIEALENSLTAERKFFEPFKILKSFNWGKVYKSPCHGDLTLENIIITADKNLYLIDFLDSFYNSWMIDIAKLLQDLELMWSFRNDTPNSNQTLRLQVAKESLIEEILQTKDGDDKLKTIYHILLLNIIRIYPYTKDRLTILFLDNAMNKLVDILTKTVSITISGRSWHRQAG